MASTVLSGTIPDTSFPSISYTNNTAQNVRIIINFASLKITSNLVSSTDVVGFYVFCGGMSYGPAPLITFGKHVVSGISRYTGFTASNADAVEGSNNNIIEGFMPTELMLAPNGTFTLSGDFQPKPFYTPSNSATGTLTYNIVVIPEAG
jgi:hypothetical protein